MALDASLVALTRNLSVGLHCFSLRQILSSESPFLKRSLIRRVASVHQEPTCSRDVSSAMATVPARKIRDKRREGQQNKKE